MIGKTLICSAIVISLGFTIERKIIDSPSAKIGEIDSEFESATEVCYSLSQKRSVFGQDNKGHFFSLYEKDPQNPKKTLIKFVRARNDRQDKNLLEYVECDSNMILKELKKGELFYLTPDEIRKRLVQDGSTY